MKQTNNEEAKVVSEKDAKNAIDTKNMKASFRFCPLFKGNCNTKCVCFSPAKYIELDEINKTGYIAYGCCNCYALMGGE